MSLTELIQKAIKSVEEGNNILGQGHDGTVYAVDKKVVLKVHTGLGTADDRIFYHHSTHETAKYEFKLGRELHQKGVQIPEYMTLFRPLDFPPLKYWGIFMERIYGTEFQLLPDGLKKKAKWQYQEQVKRIRSFGYYPEDISLDHNALFDQQQGKLILFDLVRWTKL